MKETEEIGRREKDGCSDDGERITVGRRRMEQWKGKNKHKRAVGHWEEGQLFDKSKAFFILLRVRICLCGIRDIDPLAQLVEYVIPALRDSTRSSVQIG